MTQATGHEPRTQPSERRHPPRGLGRTWLARSATLGVGLGLWLMAAAQTSTERHNPDTGPRDNTPRWHALTGARLVLGPGQVVEGGTLVLKDGVVVSAGKDVPVPAGAREWKLAGRTVYPGFIDLASTLGVPNALKPGRPARPMWGIAAELPPNPNQAPEPPRNPVARALASKANGVRAEQDVAQQLELRADEVKAVRDLGFTAVLAGPAVGQLRGQGALISTAEPKGDAKAQVIAPRVSQHLALEAGRDRSYPSALVGAMATLRQSLHDARWYRKASAATSGERVEPNASLAALLPLLDGQQTAVFLASDEQDLILAARLRDEFGLKLIAHGSGREYRLLPALKAARLPVVVPLASNTAPEVDTPDAAAEVGLHTLQHWEQASANPGRLVQAGVPVALTASGLRDPRREFWPRLREAVRRGLPADRALAALTAVPAELIGQQQRLGSLQPGRIANVVVARGDLFSSDDAVVEMTFVDGQPALTEAGERPDARGTWTASAGPTWVIAGTAERPQLQLDGSRCDILQRGAQLVLRQPCVRASSPAGAAAASAPAPAAPSNPGEALVWVAELRGEELVGTWQRGSGPAQPWSARRTAAFLPPPATPSQAAAPPAQRRYPAGAYGIEPPAAVPLLVVKNATVWTQGPAGKLPRADLLVRDGKIAAIGADLAVPAGAVVVDATGRHITPGLIDAHSHIAIRGGINEASNSITAEVRMADALDATDIDIYRGLAGGLTTAHLLHGSANTIGGQSALIKLRWGRDASGLLVEGAVPTIKFALGENVKRANWGDGTRYPVTRMGVEQTLKDAFTAAREYREAWARHKAAPTREAEPRRDLRLDTLVEILEGKRLIHIHSYRADEILMFARLAKELGLPVAAFQHVLEGYKVADAIAGIGAGGSTFSDWWGYKMEVVDAVPGNGAIMARAGVLTSFNSDSAELHRRLNTEAAKAMRYGGLSETEALNFVTLNPAKQLRIDQRTGSLEVGKDADFVVWSGSPLSTFSRAEQTWIEGRRYFDRATDAQLRAEAEQERSRLVALALPQRLQQLALSAGATGAAAFASRPLHTALHERLLHDFHHARAFRHSYNALNAWYECTEDAP